MDSRLFDIFHHGAVTGVTGSCHQLQFRSGESLLIDCDLFQGLEAKQPAHIDFSLAGVKALIVTHCHIDHVGRIPYLIAAGYDGPIYATEATALLLPFLIEDAVKLGITRDRRLIDRLLHRMQKIIVPISYKKWFPIHALPGVKAKFQPAGHILGSAYVECDIRGNRKGKSNRVVFSGDLGATYTPLLPAPRSPYRADTLILEATYGDRSHEGRRKRRQILKGIIECSLKDEGAVLIPAFSIGRTQELLYELEEIIDSSVRKQRDLKWRSLDIVVDSPLAADFTDKYRVLSALWDKEAKRKLKKGRHPLSFDQLITIESHKEHEKLVRHIHQTARPCIVIAASGMCAGGRISNYLKALPSDSRTDVVFVGYQAKGTPGRDIQKRGPRGGYVYLDGEKIEIKAEIHSVSGYSAHADQESLLNFVKRMRYPPSDIRLVHGDEQAKQHLSKRLKIQFPSAKVLIPKK